MPYKALNPENLIPLTQRPEEEARELRRKGALASAEAKRKRKLLKELLLDALQEDVALKDKDGNKKPVRAEIAITKGIIAKAISGSPRAYEVIRDTLGEKPAETTIIQTAGERPTIKEMFETKLIIELFLIVIELAVVITLLSDIIIEQRKNNINKF